MAILIKTAEEIEKMRISGRLAAEVLEMIAPYVKLGVSTAELDRRCHDHIVNQQHAIPASLGYNGFPKSVCISINDMVCHGIPRDNKFLKNGDIVNIDVTVIKEGYHGDTSKMFIVGKPTILGERLCRVAQESLYLALRRVKPGIRLHILGREIQKFVEAHDYSVVRDYGGHGIGKGFHEDPQVLHYDYTKPQKNESKQSKEPYDAPEINKEDDIILQQGMTFTIEPMINTGSYLTRTIERGCWDEVKTTDNGLSAQYEHTIAVTEYGCEILTLRNDDTIEQHLVNKD